MHSHTRPFATRADPIREVQVDDFGDGTGIKSHRSDRLCFPGIPIIPPVGLKFRTSVGLPETYDFEQLEFATACNTDSMKEILRTFGQPDGWSATPIGLVLRFGEGLDALKNLARSAETGLTMDEKAAALVCGTAQLGYAAFPAAFPPPPARPLLSASCVRAPGGCSLR